jgi:diguanylate cyclase (GGDEF)-like protein/PAS domain S-box-containing protein
VPTAPRSVSPISKASREPELGEDILPGALRHILEGIAQAVIVKDRQHRFRYLNEAACALLGRPREELLGKTDYDFVPKEQADAFCAVDDEVLASGNEREEHETITGSNGAQHTLLTRKRRVTIPGLAGNEDVVVAVITDITPLQDSIDTLRRIDERFRAMVDGAPIMIWVTDATGKSTMFNRMWTTTTGQKESDALGFGWLDVIHPEDRDRVVSNFEAADDKRLPVKVEYRLRRQDGSWGWMLDNGQPRFAENGIFLGYVGSILDITERKVAETALEASERRMTTVFGQTIVGILHRDLDNHVLMVNQRFCELLGRSREELEGLPMEAFTHPEDYPANLRLWLKHLESGEPFQIEKRYLRPDGSSVWCDVHVSFIRDEAGRPVSTIVVIADIAQRRRAEQERQQAQYQIAHMARHDILTGLPNRTYFNERLEQALETAGAHDLVAVHCLDLDGFKAINDTLGHPAGDALLRAVAERLQRALREGDTAARLGGDEFAIVQRSVLHTEDAARLAQRIIDTVGDPFEIEGVSVVVGTSVGICFAPMDGDTPDELLKAADIALYQAKSARRGSYCVFEHGMDKLLQARQATKVALAGAISRGEFELHYQPLIDTRTGAITACEALIRWRRHPDRGLVAPMDFIPIAEETGLIVPLGKWVLEQACRDASRWPLHVAVAVNLSPAQFKAKGLVDATSEALAASGLDPGRLQLEITESVLLDESAGNLGILRELRQLGVRIAMDDFGTGYSSLGYLRSFPFDKIKVDREFIKDLPDGRESLAVLRAVVGLGQSLGMTTTVEGVETEEQLAAVRAEGFGEAQGYLFSHPLPLSELALFFNAQGRVSGRSREVG